jgi:hypothetical protein
MYARERAERERDGHASRKREKKTSEREKLRTKSFVDKVDII